MADDTAEVRRRRLAEINRTYSSRAELEIDFDKVWTSSELAKEFVVIGFAAPLVIVRRLSDNAQGSLEFLHHPRLYFNWEEYKP